MYKKNLGVFLTQIGICKHGSFKG